MFGYSAGRSAYPQVYSVSNGKKTPKRETPQSKSKKHQPTSITSLRPAIDGPPSPERIREYTEQMKRSSLFGNSGRSNTFSSATPSFRSRDSVSAGTDSGLSRKSSNASNMTSPRERPESIQIFGSIFTRGGRKTRAKSNAGASSPNIKSSIEEEPSRDGVKGSESPERRHMISTPYNFQHVTHTRQDHLPDLERSSRTELVSEFSAIRASQAPTRGELKGIRAQDLHFENFSSESLVSPTSEEPPAINPKSPRRQNSVLKKNGIPVRFSTQSQIGQKSPPIRPPRPPMSPPCPIEPPARTSSRTASVLYDTFDPLATTSLERPNTNGGFRRPSPFGAQVPPPIAPPPPSWSEQDVYFADLQSSHAVTTPGDEAWPLSASGIFGAELADVQEEDEAGSRMSRISQSSSILRISQSVPSLRLRAQEQQEELPKVNEMRMSTTLGGVSHSSIIPAPLRPQLPPTFHGLRDSWEDDVDFCYENEIEADFDYQWDRCDVNDESVGVDNSSRDSTRLDYHLGEDDRSVYKGPFRPSLLVPSSMDLPELSPMSNSSTASNDPRTPSTYLRPAHIRSPSHASSFKESHGFTLSPTLLIPSDFKSQMEQDHVYEEQYNHEAMFSQEPFNRPTSLVDETTSSAASYRSSAFSRASPRSSSSTRISSNSQASQDSTNLLNVEQKGHRSVDSASSLPELIPSALRSETDLSSNFTSRNTSQEEIDSTPAPDLAGPASVLAAVGHRRNQSLVERKGINRFAPTSPVEEEPKSLSPVLEGAEPKHSRQGSAPLAGPPTPREFKGRARASTVASGAKPRLMLFPQI